MTDAAVSSPTAPDAQAASLRLATIPFIRAMGMTARPAAAPTALTSITHRGAFASHDGAGVFCDAVVAAAIDQAGSAAIWLGQGLSFPHATVTLSVTFTAAARAPRLDFEAWATSLAHGLGHTVVEAREPGGALVAHAMVNYALGVYPGDAGQSSTAPLADPSRLEGQIIHDLAGADIVEALGLQNDGDEAVRMPFGVHLVGSRDPVALHGGAIVAAMIVAAGRRAPEGLRLSHLVVDYLRSGLARETTFRASIVSQSRKTMTVRIDALQDAGDRLVATATARFFAAT